MNQTEPVEQFIPFIDILPILIGLASLAVIIALVIIILKQRRQIEQIEEQSKPRFGFLGKPLYSALVVAIMVGGFAVTFYAQKQIKEFDVSADIKLTMQINFATSGTGESRNVEFTVVPIVDDVPWGKPGVGNFNVFWTISGEQEFYEVEVGLNEAEAGGFSRAMRVGEYEVRVDIVYIGKNWTEYRDLLVN